jgi:hypothetical protein
MQVINTENRPPLIFNLQKIDGQSVIIDYKKIVYFMPNADPAMPNLKGSLSLVNGQMIHTTMTLEDYSQMISEYFYPKPATAANQEAPKEVSNNSKVHKKS